MKRLSELKVPLPAGATTTALAYPATPPGVGATLLLAHGAGAGQRSTFVVDFARAIAGLGVDVLTFNFLYMEQRRRTPDRGPALEACYRAVIEWVQHRGRESFWATASGQDSQRVDPESESRPHFFIGGKSMGGRIATQVAAADPNLPIAGLVLLGYPLHAPGRPDQLRDSHLSHIRRPMLFVQGSRDAFGTPEELEAPLGRLSPTPTVHVVKGGDHSFKVSGRDSARQTAVYDEAQRTIVEWIRSVPKVTPAADAR